NAWVRFRGRSDDPLRYCPDSVAVPDPATRDEFIKLGLASDRIAVTGHPHWDEIREFDLSRSGSRRRQIRNALPGCDNNAKVVTFAAELSSAVYPAEFQGSQDYTLRGSGRSTGRTEIALDEFLSALRPMRSAAYLVLRLHPKNVRGDFA